MLSKLFGSKSKSTPSSTSSSGRARRSSPPPVAIASAVPPHFCCPITLAAMDDPVIAPDGNSYERSALVQWAATQMADGHNPPKLPTTGTTFTLDQLVPNRSLKDAIDQWRARGCPPEGTETSHQPAAAISAARPPKVLDIAPTRYFKSPKGDAYIAVPPATGPQRHLHVVVAVDVSGSMGQVAALKDETGEKSEVANTVLDIVKYAAKAVAHMLGPNDAFSLVKFSSTAAVTLSCVPAGSENELKVIDAAIERLHTEGATNLGEGLRCCLQTIVDSHQQDPDRLNVVLMLTDGQPNEGPVALDVLGAFRRSKKEVPANASTNAPATTQGDIITKQTIVNTFAFGYASSRDGLSSSLMFDVAALGNGTFGYIPDIGFLGTQFIHCLANMRAIASVATTVLGAEVPLRTGLWFAQYGQVAFSSRNVAASLADVDFSKPINAPGNDNDALPGLTAEEIERVKGTLPRASAGFNAANTLIKLLRGDCLMGTYDKDGRRTDVKPDTIKTYTVDEVKAIFAGLDKSALAGLEEDVADQIVIAFKPEYYVRWGMHYLYGWLSAHQHQICNNFKDKSVAAHKTAMVGEIHDAYNDMFNMMPPPKPSVPLQEPAYFGGGGFAGGAQYASNSAPRARRAIQCSAMINSCHNACVHEDTRIQLADGTWRAAKEMQPGDAVRSVASNGAAKTAPTVFIDHIIRTQCLNGRIQLVCFPPTAEGQAHGLRVTPWHPVLVKDTPAQLARVDAGLYAAGTMEWMMPADTGYAVEEHECKHVYSFTVRHADGSADGDDQPHAPAIVAEGISTIYLAHNRSGAVEESSVVRHEFFGTDAVLSQLAAHFPSHRKHEFSYAPVLKAEQQAGQGAVGCAWDMGKYVGEW